MISIHNPDDATKEILCSSAPREAYQQLSQLYGGKAAGRLLTHHYFPQINLEQRLRDRIKIPRGYALKQEEITPKKLRSVYTVLRREKISHILARSSASREDSFEERFAGVGLSVPIEVTTLDTFIGDMQEFYRKTTEAIRRELKSDVHVVLDELVEVDGVHVVFSDTDLHRDATRVCTYLKRGGRICNLVPKRSSYKLGDLAQDENLFHYLNIVHRSFNDVIRVPMNIFVVPPLFNAAVDGNPFISREKHDTIVPLLNWYSLQTCSDRITEGAIRKKTIDEIRSLHRTFEDLSTYSPTGVYRPGSVPSLIDVANMIERVQRMCPDESEARQLAQVSREYESVCGYPVDLEIGFKGADLYLFQNRPIVFTQRTPVIDLFQDGRIILTTDIVKGSYHYRGPLVRIENLGSTFDIMDLPEDIARIPDYNFVYMQSGGMGARIGMHAHRYERDAIYFGDIKLSESEQVDGHGGTYISTVSQHSKIFNNPFISRFVDAMDVHKQRRTPCSVDVVSDGSAGIMRIPPTEYAPFMELLQQRLAFYRGILRLKN